ncbi:hypothetical protein ACFQI3_12665 [Hansschlegelia quercus]|uniref:hypothetical protein n=1 Tax=Hansschlegelia quercus TaxID=2528245 RepID=UPI0013EF17E2|nr:hypothetical protein [Hansschlegelia quercus]
MIEPMVARLIGCLVFAGLLSGLIVAADAASDPRKQSQRVAKAELQQRAEQVILGRP